jgi:Immunity protein 8
MKSIEFHFKTKIMFAIDYIFCSDVSNIETHLPEKQSEVFYNIELELKWMNEKETSIFQVVIVTPEALQHRIERFNNTKTRRGYILISNYTWDKSVSYIKKLINNSIIKNDKEAS